MSTNSAVRARSGRGMRILPGVAVLTPARSNPSLTEQRLLVLSRVVVSAALLIPFCGLLPELLYLTPDLNDGAFHLGVARNTLAAIREAANPLDFWIPTWLCGFPLFLYYQPGPYLLLALIHVLCGGVIPLLLLYRAMTVIALTLFPVTNYLALRWLGLQRETASWGAFLCCVLAAHGTYGIEMESFTWSGWGLFAQALALPLLPLALAGGWRAIEDGGRTLRYAALLTAVFLMHILYGYIAALSLSLTPFLAARTADVKRRLVGLVRFYSQSLALLAFFVLPLALHLAYHAKSLYDGATKFDSHGAVVILGWLCSGALLDYHRLPVVTFLVASGLYLCARRWMEGRSAVHGWIACGFILWVLLYFGRATWGPLIDLLPFSRGLHMERLSSGVHLFAIWLAAIALGALSRWTCGFESRALRAALAAGLGLLLIVPILAERIRYFMDNARNVSAAYEQFSREAGDLDPVLRVLREQPGRVYAGRRGNWGDAYKVGQVAVYHLLSAEGIEHIANVPYSWPLSSDFQLQLEWPDQATYDLYGARYVLTDQEPSLPAGTELLMHSGRHRLYRLPSQSAFGLVSVPLAVEGSSESTWYVTESWTKSPWLAARAHARLLFNGEDAGGVPVVRMADPFRYFAPGAEASTSVFDAPGLFAAPPPAAPRGVVRNVSLSRHEGRVTVELPAAAVVLFKTTYHPGWQASVDGAPVKTILLTPGFIGVEVPRGTHTLEVVYRPGAGKLALLVFGILLAIATDQWWRQKPARVQR